MTEGSMQVICRLMELEDLEQVLDIERASFNSPWTPDVFVNEFSNPRSGKYAAVLPGGEVVGYLMYWRVSDKVHIMNLATEPGRRRKGIAETMIKDLLSRCREDGVSNISLEVRKSNAPAINLYLKFGFDLVGLRKDYYINDSEDAIIMAMELS